jgi:hypothetical protein
MGKEKMKSIISVFITGEFCRKKLEDFERKLGTFSEAADFFVLRA